MEDNPIPGLSNKVLFFTIVSIQICEVICVFLGPGDHVRTVLGPAILVGGEPGKYDMVFYQDLSILI